MAFNLGQDFLGDINRISGVSISSLKKQKYFPWVLTPLSRPSLKVAYRHSDQAMKYLC